MKRRYDICRECASFNRMKVDSAFARCEKSREASFYRIEGVFQNLEVPKECEYMTEHMIYEWNPRKDGFVHGEKKD